jgi:serine protease Do
MRIPEKIITYFLMAAILAGGFFYVTKKEMNFNSRLADLSNELVISDQKITALQKNLNDLAQQAKVSADEAARREVVKEKSQQELLTSSVARVTPAVVSIVISKDVPQLEITYVNPFGDDPFFKDFGFQVPVYQQRGTQKQQIGAGTGFLIRSNGYILTNRHVVEDTAADYTVLLADGSQKIAEVIWRDVNQDIAIIKIPGLGYATEQLGDSGSLQLGESVFAVGNALGQYNNSVSVGIISGLNRTIQASDQNGTTETLAGIIQTDAAINPGNSGGPLVDLNGKVIGINVATVQGSNNISFSIPVNIVKGIINSVLK